MPRTEVRSTPYSSHVSPDFLRERFMGTIESRVYGKEAWVDPLDPRIGELLRGVKTTVPYTFKGEPMPTVSYKAYGTTTLWWVIIMYNGFIHPDEIPIGTELQIPDLSVVRDNLTKIDSKRGELVVV